MENDISGNVVSGLEMDEVTDNDSFSADGLFLSISGDISHLGDEALEIVHQSCSARGLHEGEDSSHKHDQAEYNTQVEVGLILFLVFLDGVTKEAEESTEPEEEGEDTGHLFNEEAVPWNGSLVGKSVRSVLIIGFLGRFGGHSVNRMGIQIFAELNLTPSLFSPVTDAFILGDGVTHACFAGGVLLLLQTIEFLERGDFVLLERLNHVLVVLSASGQVLSVLGSTGAGFFAALGAGRCVRAFLIVTGGGDKSSVSLIIDVGRSICVYLCHI
jgi:hypothetical protein